MQVQHCTHFTNSCRAWLLYQQQEDAFMLIPMRPALLFCITFRSFHHCLMQLRAAGRALPSLLPSHCSMRHLRETQSSPSAVPKHQSPHTALQEAFRPRSFTAAIPAPHRLGRAPCGRLRALSPRGGDRDRDPAPAAPRLCPAPSRCHHPAAASSAPSRPAHLPQGEGG